MEADTVAWVLVIAWVGVSGLMAWEWRRARRRSEMWQGKLNRALAAAEDATRGAIFWRDAVSSASDANAAARTRLLAIRAVLCRDGECSHLLTGPELGADADPYREAEAVLEMREGRDAAEQAHTLALAELAGEVEMKDALLRVAQDARAVERAEHDATRRARDAAMREAEVARYSLREASEAVTRAEGERDRVEHEAGALRGDLVEIREMLDEAGAPRTVGGDDPAARLLSPQERILILLTLIAPAPVGDASPDPGVQPRWVVLRYLRDGGVSRALFTVGALARAEREAERRLDEAGTLREKPLAGKGVGA